MTKEGLIIKAGKALEYVFKNPILFLPDILFLVITALLITIFLFINNLLPDFSSVINSTALAEFIKSKLAEILQHTSSLLKMIISFLVLLIINLLIGIRFIAMRYLIIREILAKQKIKFLEIYKLSRSFVIPILTIKILFLIIYAVSLVIIFLIPLLAGLPFMSILLIFLLSILLNVLFFFSYPIMFLENNKNPLKVIKMSVSFFSKNVGYSTGAFFLVLLISILATIILMAILPTQDSTENLMGLLALQIVSILTSLLWFLFSIALTLWSETFSFITYKSRA